MPLYKIWSPELFSRGVERSINTGVRQSNQPYVVALPGAESSKLSVQSLANPAPPFRGRG